MIQPTPVVRNCHKLYEHILILACCKLLQTVMICGGDAGERHSLTIRAQGTPFPLRKTKDMEERRTPEQDKNGGTLFPVAKIKQVKINQAVARHFL